jgi:hypothetical protein
MANGYKDLLVWQKARDLAVSVYGITNEGDFKKDYGLRDQVRRSAVSIPSNIAEGDERGTNKESVRFLYIAKGRALKNFLWLQYRHAGLDPASSIFRCFPDSGSRFACPE